MESAWSAKRSDQIVIIQFSHFCTDWNIYRTIFFYSIVNCTEELIAFIGDWSTYYSFASPQIKIPSIFPHKTETFSTSVVYFAEKKNEEREIDSKLTAIQQFELETEEKNLVNKFEGAEAQLLSVNRIECWMRQCISIVCFRYTSFTPIFFFTLLSWFPLFHFPVSCTLDLLLLLLFFGMCASFLLTKPLPLGCDYFSINSILRISTLQTVWERFYCIQVAAHKNKLCECVCVCVWRCRLLGWHFGPLHQAVVNDEVFPTF